MNARRWLPRPAMSATLLLTWLLLNQSLAAGQLLLGALLGLLLPPLALRLAPTPSRRLARPLLALRLLLLLLWDIVVANLVVARQVLLQRRRLQPAFVELPLQRDDPLVGVWLACMITLTPGTLSVRIEREQRRLLLHALHVTDTAALVADIKQRYERNLLEIFPC